LLVAGAQRVISEEIPAPPEDVRAFYTDLNNIRTVHPLVVSVSVTSKTPLANGYSETWRVKDRIPLGPFTLPVSYVTHMTVTTVGDVIAEAWQFPRVRLYNMVSFEPVDNIMGLATRITENLTIEAPRPLASFTVRQACKAHIEMLAGIRRHFGD
jgi:hypothetical protein